MKDRRTEKSRQTVENEKLKALLKTAIVEVLEERQDLLQDAIVGALEDVWMTRAIAAGQQTPHVSRADVFTALDGGERRFPFGKASGETSFLFRKRPY